MTTQVLASSRRQLNCPDDGEESLYEFEFSSNHSDKIIKKKYDYKSLDVIQKILLQQIRISNMNARTRICPVKAYVRLVRGKKLYIDEIN